MYEIELRDADESAWSSFTGAPEHALEKITAEVEAWRSAELRGAEQA